MKYTDIIWDFNGTILDDIDVGIASVNKLLSDCGKKTLSGREEYYEKFGFPIIEYYRRLGFDFDVTPYDVLAVKWVDEYLSKVGECKLYPDVKSSVERFKSAGLTQYIISATERDMLLSQLDGLGIKDEFGEVYGLDNIHAASKQSLAQKWKSEHPEAVPIFIGDTEHDLEVARAIGADCVLVAAGHQPKEKLVGSSADALFDTLGQAVDYILAKND